LVERLVDHAVSGIHAYFAHTPAEIAAYVARWLNIPFGFSVHARDARKVPVEELWQRARLAACVVACNPDVVRHFDGANIPVKLIPHGVDTQRFQPQPPPVAPPIRLLAVGRLVEKKGFDVLIQAAAQLSFPFLLRIIGDGPLQSELAAAIAAANLRDRVELCRSITHAELPTAYAEAHIVVAPSVVDRTGDRDGLPNVVLEAMASGRAVVASDVGAISSAIQPGESGLLVAPGDPGCLAAALEQLAGDPQLRSRLGHHARCRAEADFRLDFCTARFCNFLAATCGLYERQP
jgi:glycosyltransferase involved in cell wall biosynthesis